MAYIVTRNILDTKDNRRLYEAGEVYPRPDLVVSEARLQELLAKGAIVSDDKTEPAVEVIEKPKRSRKKVEPAEG